MSSCSMMGGSVWVTVVLIAIYPYFYVHEKYTNIKRKLFPEKEKKENK